MRFINRHQARGFTLVEIMIVVAIIALIAAIAVPNLLRARHNANETAAIGNTRTLLAALESFRAAQSPPSYPANLGVLSTATPQYVSTALTTNPRQGYNFTYVQVSASQYTLTAAPVTAGVTGTRNFFVDESGVIRVGTNNTGTPIE